MPRLTYLDALEVARLDEQLKLQLRAAHEQEEPKLQQALDFATTYRLTETAQLQPRISTGLPPNSHYILTGAHVNRWTKNTHTQDRETLTFKALAKILTPLHDVEEDLAKQERDEELEEIEREAKAFVTDPHQLDKVLEREEEHYMKERWPQVRAQHVIRGAQTTIDALKEIYGSNLSAALPLRKGADIEEIIHKVFDFVTPDVRTRSKFSGAYYDMLRRGLTIPNTPEDFYASMLFAIIKCADNTHNEEETYPATKKVRHFLRPDVRNEHLNALLDITTNERAFRRKQKKISRAFHEAVDNAYKARGRQLLRPVTQTIVDYKGFSVEKETLNYFNRVENNRREYMRNGFLGDVAVTLTALRHMTENHANHARMHAEQFTLYGIRTRDHDASYLDYTVQLPDAQFVEGYPALLNEISLYAATPQARSLQAAPMRGRFGKFSGIYASMNRAEMKDETEHRKLESNLERLALISATFGGFSAIAAPDIEAYTDLLSVKQEPVVNISDIWQVVGNLSRL